MLFQLLSVVGACTLLGLVVAATSRFVWNFAKEHYRHALTTAEAAWELQAQQERGSTLMESFTLGWLNIILQHIWVPVLEKHVAKHAHEILFRMINNMLRRNAHKAPFKFIESCAVEEVTFGRVPPTFQLCFAKFDPKANKLHFGVNMKFNTMGCRAVLCPKLSHKNLLASGLHVRLECTHLKLSGRLNLALHLCKEAPGIKQLDVSFADEPKLDLKITPLGVSWAELPGLLTALRNGLQKALTKRMVEPRKIDINVQRIYHNNHVRKAGGPGGILRITILSANNLSTMPSSAPSQAPPSAANGTTRIPPTLPPMDLFCEVRYNREVHRTPIVRVSGAPEWNWQFDLKLPQAFPPPQADTIKFCICSARTVGDPLVLAAGKVCLQDIELQPNVDPNQLTLALSPLTPPAVSTPTLHVALSLLQIIQRPGAEPPPPPTPSPAPSAPPFSRTSTSNIRSTSTSNAAVVAPGSTTHRTSATATQPITIPGASALHSHSLSSSLPFLNPAVAATAAGLSSSPFNNTLPTSNSAASTGGGWFLGSAGSMPTGTGTGSGSPRAAGQTDRRSTADGPPSLGGRSSSSLRHNQSFGSVRQPSPQRSSSFNDTALDGAGDSFSAAAAAATTTTSAAPDSPSHKRSFQSRHNRSASDGVMAFRSLFRSHHSKSSLGGGSAQQAEGGGDRGAVRDAGDREDTVAAAAGGGGGDNELLAKDSPLADGSKLGDTGMAAAGGLAHDSSSSPSAASMNSDAFEGEEDNDGTTFDDVTSREASGSNSSSQELLPPSTAFSGLDSIPAPSELPPPSLHRTSSPSAMRSLSPTTSAAPYTTTSLQSLAQVAKLQRLLDQERRAVSELQAQCKAMGARLLSYERIRRAENKRALLEGARFLLQHKEGRSKLLRLWFDASTLNLNLSEPPKETHTSDNSRPTTPTHTPSKPVRSVSLSSISQIEASSALFPHQQQPQGNWGGIQKLLFGWKSSSGQQQAGPETVTDSRCMSLVMADGSVWNLQLPSEGNGRSREEWVAAVADVAEEAKGGERPHVSQGGDVILKSS